MLFPRSSCCFKTCGGLGYNPEMNAVYSSGSTDRRILQIYVAVDRRPNGHNIVRLMRERHQSFHLAQVTGIPVEFFDRVTAELGYSEI